MPCAGRGPHAGDQRMQVVACLMNDSGRRMEEPQRRYGAESGQHDERYECVIPANVTRRVSKWRKNNTYIIGSQITPDGRSEKFRRMGWNPRLKVMLSEFLLSGQLQVDPVIGMADPLDRFVIKSFDLFEERSQSRSLVPDLPRCTAIQGVIHPNSL